MWFLTHSVGHRNAQIVFQTKIKAALEVILYSHLYYLLVQVINLKEKNIFNFIFAIKMWICKKNASMLVFQRNMKMGRVTQILPQKNSSKVRDDFNLSSSEWMTQYLSFLLSIGLVHKLSLLHSMLKWLNFCILAHLLEVYQPYRIPHKQHFYFETFANSAKLM